MDGILKPTVAAAEQTATAPAATPINSALSTPAEVAKALGYIHAKFNETLASYNQGSHDTISYIQETDGTLTKAPNYLYDERLTHQPEIYLRMADVIGNAAPSQKLNHSIFHARDCRMARTYMLKKPRGCGFFRLAYAMLIARAANTATITSKRRIGPS
ncbi:hypothetical protein [Paenibacillus sp. CF384]|uniref:hypothetical protein n=1 Tax=Paenibacillus sp. CF384 TaxID=1884382 RepID=UPI00089622BB|nr:hypothetical protein [Paenibacillus sp. CF384]SDW22876.1 hypothetical protein SAMN05518855_1001728 [Paenibacillus sp. CF384]